MSQAPNGPYHRDFLPHRETVLIEQCRSFLTLSSCLNLEMMKALRECQLSVHMSQRRSLRQLTHAAHSSSPHLMSSLHVVCGAKYTAEQLRTFWSIQIVFSPSLSPHLDQNRIRLQSVTKIWAVLQWLKPWKCLLHWMLSSNPFKMFES